VGRIQEAEQEKANMEKQNERLLGEPAVRSWAYSNEKKENRNED
jgi:hypothetical protein